jgi:hypothetical protein
MENAAEAAAVFLMNFLLCILFSLIFYVSSQDTKKGKKKV